MYRKIKIIILTGIFTLGAFVLNAQTDPGKAKSKGEIVMTRSELQAFLEKVAQARKVRVEKDMETTSSKNYNLQYLGNNYGVSTASAPLGRPSIPLSSYVPVQNMSRNELLREIDALNSRVNSMYGYGGGGAGNSTTFITQPGGGQGGYYPSQSQPPIVISAPQAAPDNRDLRWKIDSLQQKVNLLSSASFVPVIPVASVDSIASSDSITSNDVVNEKIEEIIKLKREIELTQDSLIAKSKLTSEAKDVVKQYGTSQMQVFFDNNVSEVSSRYKDEVESAAIALRKNPQLSVVLKGYASPSGNAKLNQDLSMRRNEAVKRMLIDYGVFPDQITSVFYD